MCTVLLLLRPGDAWPLLVGANRDERLDRAFEPPARAWPDAPGVVAGRDLLGGGSWFGVNDDGVVATIVNGMERLGPIAGKASRGELVVRVLRERDARSAARVAASLAAQRYRGYTLLVADRASAFAVTSDEHTVRIDALAPGHHMLTPEGSDVPSSPRYVAHFAAFRDAAPPDPSAGDWRSWIDLLRHADDDDPHRAMTVVTDHDFGTVCSTLLALPAATRATPVLLFANGPPTHADYARITSPWDRGNDVEGHEVMQFKTLRDAGVRGKRVLLREDLNVPMKAGAIADETRITAALPTLRWLHEQGAKTIILSHLGRPDGTPDAKYSLRPIGVRLTELLGTDVRFVEDCVGEAAVTVSKTLPDGGFALFENVRFHREEESNDPVFARELARSGDLYVNDAFGTAHRAHASTAGVAADLPSYAGFLMEAELAALARLTDDPAHPFVCAIGGAKVVDKVGVFENLVAKVDAFVIGGGMANTFLAAHGINVGTSLRDPDLVPAQRIIALALSKGVQLHLPTDAVVADAFDADDTARTVPLDDVGDGMILDIGPETARAYAAVLRGAKTIVFNGPMGVYEKTPYQNGTRVVGAAIADATQHGATSVVGGGDAAAAAHALGFAAAMTHVSTGGGATLEFLEGKTLPGVAALEQSAARA